MLDPVQPLEYETGLFNQTYLITRCPTEIKNKTWGNISQESFCDTIMINGVYDEIVHFRRNIFNVPSARAGKAFKEELTFWIKQFNSKLDLNYVALKAFVVLPTFILQKPSAIFNGGKEL